MEEVQRLLSSAARDCVPEERNSFVSFQANTGVEVSVLFVLYFFIVSIYTKVFFQDLDVFDSSVLRTIHGSS